MNTKKLLSLVLALVLVCSLAACGVKGDNKTANMNRNDASMTDEPKNAEEALTLHKKLLEQENILLSENTGLWEKVFMEADKGMVMVEAVSYTHLQKQPSVSVRQALHRDIQMRSVR